jgi:hypothetical protein
MNQVSPRRWREVLLSGEVKRARGQLGDAPLEGGRRCCLGVLADLMEVNYDPMAGLPPTLPEWLDKEQAQELAARNDDKERGEFWIEGLKGGVIEYIDDRVIPEYDQAERAKA